jgi:molybdate transport system permease protein
MIPDLTPVWLTLKLAAVTTALLLLVSTPVAWWLSHSRSRARTLVEAVVALPLVLPPTVLGFYLLLMLGPDGAIGSVWQGVTGSALTFTFSGLVVASMLYSLPFVVQPLQVAFDSVGKRPLEVAQTLRASRLQAFYSVILPLSARGYLTATVLGFAHTLGEFGVVLMVGGNIPGKTQVLSVVIYDHVESLDYATAHVLSAGLLAFSFIVLLVVYTVNRRYQYHIT